MGMLRSLTALRAAPVALALLLTSCAARRAGDEGPSAAEIEAADRLYAQRADFDRLIEAQQAYLSLLADEPNHPALLGRLSIAYSAQAYGYPETVDPERVYALAREYGLRCLALNPAWTSRLALGEGRINRRVAAALTTSDVKCLQASLIAWARWLEIRGPGAHLDLAPLLALSNRLEDLSNGFDWVAPWALGMVGALPPAALEPDLAAAAEHFKEAARRHPGLVTPKLDWLVHVQADIDDSDLSYQAAVIQSDYAAMAESGSWILENRRGLEVLAAIIDSGEVTGQSGAEEVEGETGS